VILLVIQTARLFRSIARILNTHEGRGLSVLIGLQLVIGASFYHFTEGWRWLDAFYFCVASLTTAGYGDLTPVTDAGKVFTMVYLLTGIGLFVSLGALIARQLLDDRERRRAAPEGA
jgi:voltage-gated potassium channel